MALADLDELLIRATYSTRTAAASIADVAMDTAVPPQPGLPPAPEVEECRCPPGYHGLSCQVTPHTHTPPASPFPLLGGHSTDHPLFCSPCPPPPPAGLCPRLHPHRRGAVPGALRALRVQRSFRELPPRERRLLRKAPA